MNDIEDAVLDYLERVHPDIYKECVEVAHLMQKYETDDLRDIAERVHKEKFANDPQGI